MKFRGFESVNIELVIYDVQCLPHQPGRGYLKDFDENAGSDKWGIFRDGRMKNKEL